MWHVEVTETVVYTVTVEAAGAAAAEDAAHQVFTADGPDQWPVEIHDREFVAYCPGCGGGGDWPCTCYDDAVSDLLVDPGGAQTPDHYRWPATERNTR